MFDVTRAVSHSVKQVCYLLLAPPAASLQLVISWKYFKRPRRKDVDLIVLCLGWRNVRPHRGSWFISCVCRNSLFLLFLQFSPLGVFDCDSWVDLWLDRCELRSVSLWRRVSIRNRWIFLKYINKACGSLDVILSLSELPVWWRLGGWRQTSDRDRWWSEESCSTRTVKKTSHFLQQRPSLERRPLAAYCIVTGTQAVTDDLQPGCWRFICTTTTETPPAPRILVCSDEPLSPLTQL